MADLFRKEALDTVATPEQLDRQVKIMGPATWLICLIFIVGIATLILWSCTYHISGGINIDGVVFTNNGVVQTRARRGCTVTDVLVAEGDLVRKGDIVAVLSYDEMLGNIEGERARLNTLTGQELQAALEGLNKLISDYVAYTVVKSSSDGYIQGVVGEGTALNTGEVICSLMPEGGYNEVIAYAPMETAQNITTGMKAQISPAHAPREEYGYMTGTVTAVGDTLVTEASIMEEMGTLLYVEDILPDSSFVQIRVRLDIDPTSDNGYSWSNSRGEGVSVGLGSQCSIFVVTNEYYPIELLID